LFCNYHNIFSSQENLKSVSGKDDKEESNKPDYDKDKDQLEEEQEEETGETTNIVLDGTTTPLCFCSIKYPFSIFFLVVV
jgi:hypothetical protein